MNVVDEIAAERARQVSVGGWTPEHDDEHRKGELAIAAGCYAKHSSGRRDINWTRQPGDDLSRVPRGWPWLSRWWKPTTPRRDLIKAAALIVAEIERIDRASLRSKSQAAVTNQRGEVWMVPIAPDATQDLRTQIEAAIPCGEPGDMIDVNRKLIAEYVMRALGERS